MANPRFPTDSAAAPRIRNLLETRIIQPTDGLGPPWQIGPYNTGDQVVFFLEEPGTSRRNFIQGIVLRTSGPRGVCVFFQDGAEETKLNDDYHLRNVKPEGIAYFVGDPVFIRVHDPARRETGVITKLPESVGTPNTFEVKLDLDGSLVLTPLSHMVLFAGRFGTVKQVLSFHNVEQLTLLDYLRLTEAEYLAMTEPQYLLLDE